MTLNNMQSSRLIVKNLPKSVTEDKLRKHFCQKGEITDVKLKYNEQGKFRNFAFIGFRTPEAAEEAREYFDKTFFGTARITVETCTNLAERPPPRSSRVREKLLQEKLSAKALGPDVGGAKPQKRKKEDEILEKCEEDPAFVEFLQAHKRAAATWGNDTLVDDLLQKKKKVEGETEKAVETEISEPEKSDTTVKEAKKRGRKCRPNEFFTLKLRDVPKKAKKKHIKDFFAPLKLKSLRFPVGVRGIVYIGFETKEEMTKALQKHKSILLGNMIKMRVYHSDEGSPGKRKFDLLREELEHTSEPVAESGRIFIRNLPYTTNEDEVTKIFSEFGPITEIHLPIDKITRKLKGFGFVSFMLPEHADKAFKSLDGTIFQGRVLHLLPAKAQEDLTANDVNAGSSYKTEKEQKLKKTAGSSHNWNTLFLGSNAISKVISGKYGISREEMLLDKSDEKDSRLASVGVRMALAETEIVSETKKFLEKNGVCLDAFDSDKKAERSKTIMLAKNLPAGTTLSDLRDAFNKHGVLNRIILPPSGVTAIVEFAEPAEARAAFKKLAYSKFFDVPLYLEWAPVGVLVSRESKEKMSSESKEKMSSESKEKMTSESKEKSPASAEESKQKSNGTKILVRNVPFSSTQEEITDLFKTFGKLKAVRLPKKMMNSSEHRGFAFVEFYLAPDAKKAFDTMCKSTHLYGRRLVLEWAAQDESIEELRAKTARLAQAIRSEDDPAGAGSTKKRLQRYFQSQGPSGALKHDDDEGEFE